jgi:hypothetical protein
VDATVYTDDDAEQVGHDLSEDLIAKGAKRILDAINLPHID